MSKIDDVLQLIDLELEKKKWHRTDLAKKLNRSDAWLSKIMKKERGLSIQTLIEIADALGIDPASLLPSDENKIPKVTFEEYIRRIIKDEFEKLTKDKK